MHPHVIVDGSNLATEGRSKPSLAQLNDAVTTFMAENPGTTVTVVVDATFGHRIDKKEKAEFDEAIANNELVAPPAGAIGRGDAFVLGIADKVGAAVLSNDSYQEFHGRYEWLFTEGRLIGGKPVPNIGWVFVERLPVRGPVSRRATAAGGAIVPKSPRTAGRRATPRSASLGASGPPPVPKAPPPGATVATGRHSNDLLPFVAFQESHAVGSTVKGVVEAYSSHGATVRVGDATLYVPLRLLADPPPRSARDHFRVGETVTLMVAGYRPDRRSIDAGVPAIVKAAQRRDAGSAPTGAAAQSVDTGATKPRRLAVAKAGQAADKSAAKRTPVRKSAAKKAPAKKLAAKKAPAKKQAASASRATKAPAGAAAKKAPAKAVAKKSTAGRPATTSVRAAKPAKKVAKKTAAKK
jgi:hypothetical protein